MKILHVHPSLAGGGIEAMICGLANEMANTEDVTVCSIFEPKKTDVFYHKLSNRVNKVSCHKTKEGFSVKELIEIWRIIKKGKYDVVHMHGNMYNYHLSIIFSIFSKTAFFYTIHSDARMENSPWDKRLILVKKLFFKLKIVHPITISDTSQQSFTQFYRCKSRLIYNGIPTPHDSYSESVDIGIYKPTNETKVFFHPGRISIPKNQETLCRVFKRLIEEGEDVVLLIAGSNDEKDVFAKLKPYFCDRIQYLGLLHNVPGVMRNCDAMCLSSIWEGLPVALLESLAVGCIPICTPVGGIVNVIKDGKNGVLSASASEEDYLNAIRRYLKMSIEEKNAIKENAQDSFENYKIENTAHKYIEYYKSELRQ